MPHALEGEPRIFARVEERDGQKRGSQHLGHAVGGWDGIRGGPPRRLRRGGHRPAPVLYAKFHERWPVLSRVCGVVRKLP